MSVISLCAERERRGMTPEQFRSELSELSCLYIPGEQRLNSVTRAPEFDEKSEDHLRRMFRAYGITGLDPLGEFQLVMMTWRALTEVGLDLAAKKSFAEVYAARVGTWSRKYIRYVDALWSGNRRRISLAAVALGITAGVPSGDIYKKGRRRPGGA